MGQAMNAFMSKLAALRLRLITDWRRAYKLASVQITAAFAFLFGLGPTLVNSWSFIPDDLKNALPQGMSRWIALAALGLIMFGRMTKLERKPPDGDSK